MRPFFYLFICLILIPRASYALSKSEIRSIIKTAHPGAHISEIEKETFRGENVWEVDFRHEGQKLEAIISLDGEIIKIQIDD